MAPAPAPYLPPLKHELLQLAQAALSAIEDPTRWQEYLRLFVAYFKGNLSYLAIFSNQFNYGAMSIYEGFTPEDISEWESKWATKDPWMRGRDLSSLPLEKVVPSHFLCSDADLVSQDIYPEFLLPRRLHYGGGVNFLRTPDLSAIQIMIRSREEGPLTQAEVEDWDQLAGYVKTAVTASLEMSRLRAENQIFNTHIATLGNGLLFLSPQGRIVRSNDMAKEIIGRRADIVDDSGHLKFAKAAIDAQFRSALKDFSGDDFKTPTSDSWRKIAISQDQGTGTSPLLAILSPVTQASQRSFDLSSYSILMYLIEPQTPNPPDTLILQKLFGWTPTESRLAGLLATGQSLEEVSAELHITVQTARTHLKHLYAKTGFGRQGELIAFINRLSLRDPAR